MFDIRGVRSIYYVLYVRHTWCLLSNLIIYVVDRKRVGKVASLFSVQKMRCTQKNASVIRMHIY